MSDNTHKPYSFGGISLLRHYSAQQKCSTLRAEQNCVTKYDKERSFGWLQVVNWDPSE